MTQWYVQLVSTDDTLLTFLATCLNDPLCTVMMEDDKYFWLSSEFDLITPDWKVRQYAKERLPLLNSIVHLKFNWNISWIRVDDIYRRDNNGHLVRDHASSDLIMHSYPDESSLQAANAQPPSIIDILVMAKNNLLVEEALQNYSSPHNWHNLRKILEIVSKDVRKLERNGKLPKGTWNGWARGWVYDFEQTANSYHWSKLGASHSSVKSEKRRGVNPMPLDEATERITDIIIKWLKCNL